MMEQSLHGIGSAIASILALVLAWPRLSVVALAL